MKSFRIVFPLHLLAFIFLLSSGSHLTSCKKETIRDTTIIHDTTTVTIRDTITKIDTICKLELGMVAHFNFTNGSLLDETDYHNDIIFNTATATTGKSGVANSAFLFNGSTYMKVANSTSLNPQKISLMARVRADDFYMGTCHANQILGKGWPDQLKGFYTLRITDPYGDCYGVPDVTKEFFAGGYGDNIPGGSGTGAVDDTSYIQVGQWYNVVYTYDGTTSKIYVNGKLKSEQQKTVTFTPNQYDLFIGHHEDPQFPYWFYGAIDEIRIYDRALNGNEARMLSVIE